MIGWLNPAAFWGLALLAVPVVIHLLGTRHVRRVPFPTLRFVRASRTSALRVRRLTDLVLLVLRMAMVAAAVCAIAAPLVLTKGRLAEWNDRVARVVVVDSSDSMNEAGADGRTAAQHAEEAADGETRAARWSTRIPARDLGAGLTRASAWLASAPPARQEIVVLSDFQQGALSEDDVAPIPGRIGVRLVQVGEDPLLRRTTGVALAGAPGIPPRTQDVELSAGGTRVSLLSTPANHVEGFRIMSSAQPAETDRLLRAVAAAGAAALNGEQPMAVYFPGAAVDTRIQAVRTPWMMRTLLRLREDATVTHLARADQATGLARTDPWTVVARSERGETLARAAAAGPELIVQVAAPPSSLFAAALVRGLLSARYGPYAQPEVEPLRETAARLAAFTRAPAAVDAGTWRQAESSDARWCWVAVLILLGGEQWVRSRRSARPAEGVPRVAA